MSSPNFIHPATPNFIHPATIPGLLLAANANGNPIGQGLDIFSGIAGKKPGMGHGYETVSVENIRDDVGFSQLPTELPGQAVATAAAPSEPELPTTSRPESLLATTVAEPQQPGPGTSCIGAAHTGGIAVPAEPHYIPLMLRLAFKHAKQGDTPGAWYHWQKAIDAGYQPNPKTERPFQKGGSGRNLKRWNADPTPAT